MKADCDMAALERRVLIHRLDECARELDGLDDEIGGHIRLTRASEIMRESADALRKIQG
jgi:hypothetical protein